MKYTFPIILLAICLSCNTTHESNKRQGQTNRLIDERSPYLLQHAYNPVDWYPWGDEALEKAQTEDKLLIISVGYSACHWCHVMEHESFSDSTVAAFMNEHFVSIKVDREERPDIDDVYMTACQFASQGNCGWPLNAFALPDGKPVWAGTYFPKKNWLEILEYFQKLYAEEPEQAITYADQLTKDLVKTDSIKIFSGEADFQEEKLDVLAETIMSRVDFVNGGRKGDIKFPIPNVYEFLLRYHALTGNEKALQAVEVTLDNIAMGGIYDHLGGGFARYSTDPFWKVPHFEKMLYDNAQLISLYSQAFQVTRNPLYQQAVEESLEFVRVELTNSETGGFYSSLDADSEGEEGTYYIWEKTEIDSILQDEVQAELFNAYYEVRERGNWENKENVLHRRTSIGDLAKRFKLTEEEINTQLTAAKTKMLEARDQREKPLLDDKILASWNGLMLKGQVDAYRAFGWPSALQAAIRNAQFLREEMIQADYRILRNHNSDINGFLDDYAFVIQGLIALYEVTFDQQWLDLARSLTEYCLEHFHDPESSMFYFTSDEDAALVARKKVLLDNVIPASNSAMSRNLAMLGNLYYLPEWVELSQRMLLNIWEDAGETQFGDSYSNWGQLYIAQVFPPYEIAILGQEAGKLRDEMMLSYFPSAVFLGGDSEGTLELLKDKVIDNETFIYVCQNKICKLPVQTVSEAITLVDFP